MRIGCLQFAPQVGTVEANVERVNEILGMVDPQQLEQLDLLVLPEMAFSGYNFKSAEHIQPYLELAGTGPTGDWARKRAVQHGCTVIVGYPEKVEAGGEQPEYYNAAAIVDSSGELLGNYRKAFLYYTDQTWAREGGKGFFQGELPKIGMTAMGICMDINPYKFETGWEEYEFGVHVLRVRPNLVILSMAWLTLKEAAEFTSDPGNPDMETVGYWVQRLEPLIRLQSNEEIIVVFANRCGVESDAVYAGSSAVMGIVHGKVYLYGMLGRGEEKLLCVDTNEPPSTRLEWASQSSASNGNVEL